MSGYGCQRRQIGSRSDTRARIGCRAAGVAALFVLTATPAGHALAQPVTGLDQPRGSIGRAMPVAVFGKDDRIALPQSLSKVREGLGVLFNLRTRTVCTAFCVDAGLIATAAHCLYKPASDKQPRLQDFWFARNYDVRRDYARIAGFDTGSAGQHIASGAMSLSTTPPIDATSDWAVVKLSKPVCRGHALEVEAATPDQVIAASKAGHFFQLSFHRDYQQWRPAYSQPCVAEKTFGSVTPAQIARDFSRSEALVLHTCDTGGASSGSPLFRQAPQGPRVVGINVGTYVLSRVLTQDGKVTRKLASDTIANTGVASRAFTGAIAAMRSAEILVGPARIRELQGGLKDLGLYGGALDGTYGAELRAAIERFETSRQRPALGLATRALLDEVRTAQKAR
ncbi:MAG TPA: trypsin-like peptidase domain-containing protein [Hyphomicrobiaceae bacterium]|nr:trypsin-like peptidase domain-containing protein [Hyphomicrobiaceae bacterium]